MSLTIYLGNLYVDKYKRSPRKMKMCLLYKVMTICKRKVKLKIKKLLDNIHTNLHEETLKKGEETVDSIEKRTQITNSQSIKKMV